jgi:hypothetical protein
MAITLPLIVASAICQSAFAFSRIQNVDGWDTAQLNKAGISVKPRKHRRQSEDPPLEWIQVTFDCSRLPMSQDVLSTAKVNSGDETTSSNFRVERDPQGEDKVSVVFALQGEYSPPSHVTVVIWKEKPDGGAKAHGYRLSVRRVVELARVEGLSD